MNIEKHLIYGGNIFNAGMQVGDAYNRRFPRGGKINAYRNSAIYYNIIIYF